jgi:L-asparagine transporter-like permease
MKTKLQMPEEIGNVNKFTNFQIHNKFKIIGFVICVVTILLIVTSFKNYFIDEKFHELFERVVLSFMVVGMLIVSISREKIEDELTSKIRLQSYYYAGLVTVIVYLILPFIHFILECAFSSTPTMNGSGDLSILLFLLFIQIITFRRLKKAYNEE